MHLDFCLYSFRATLSAIHTRGAMLQCLSSRCGRPNSLIVRQKMLKKIRRYVLSSLLSNVASSEGQGRRAAIL